MGSVGPALVVVLMPEDTRFLDAEVAGQAAGRYLLNALLRLVDAEVTILTRGAASPAWCAGITAATPSSLDHRPPGPALIVDGRVWLSDAALERLWRSDRETAITVTTMPTHKRALDDAAPSRLATWLPEYRGGAIDLADVDAPEFVNRGATVDAGGLDSLQRLYLLDSFVAVAALERHVLLDRATGLMASGVRIHDPSAVYIRGELSCGHGVELDVGVIVEGHVRLGSGVTVGAHAILRECVIGSGSTIRPFSLVEQSTIGSDTVVGPYARIRPASVIGDHVQIGNYVEIKSSRIGSGSRINHHSFVGDADLAENVTIGAGTITCNHDGTRTVQTVIERGAYIGSGVRLVAPVRVGSDATIGAGSTITHDVPPSKLTVARSRQATIDHWPGRKSRQRQ